MVPIPTFALEVLAERIVIAGNIAELPYIVPNDKKPPKPSCNPPPIDPPNPATLKSIELL